MDQNPPQSSGLTIDYADGVAEIRLDRPRRSNSFDAPMWQNLRNAFTWADATPEVRVAILCGSGRNFCAGIDLAMLSGITELTQAADKARGHEALRRLILDLQDCLSSVERCRKPVLAAIQGACIGAGVDLITCCDMRYASAEAFFSVREVDVGLTADVGTLQRLPRLVPPGIARELAYTARNFDAAEAQAIGLLNRLFETPEALLDSVRALARQIAEKSPLAIRGTKEMLNYSRDHSVADGLNYIATWNAAMLVSADLTEALKAMRERRKPSFSD